MEVLKSMIKIFQEYLWDDPVFIYRWLFWNLSAKPLKNTCEETHISESCSVSMKKSLNLWTNSFLIYHKRYTPSLLYLWLFLIPTIKMLYISFSIPLSKKFIFIHLVYNEDKIISFLYRFILTYIYIVQNESMENLSK